MSGAGVNAFDAAVGAGLTEAFWQTTFGLIEGGVEGLIENYYMDNLLSDSIDKEKK